MRAWCAAVLLAALVVSAPAGAAALKARTFRVDNALPGKNPDGVTARPVISGNGYVIAYDSDSANLADDPNGFTRDVFVRSLSYTRSLLVSTGLGGKPANGRSVAPAISSDGFTVAYQSSASNLTPGDRNHHTDVFLRHAADPTQLVSVARDGGPANGDSAQADISANGRFVAFTSAASNLVTGDTNHHRDVFLRDMRRGVTVRVSHNGHGAARQPAVSPDGHYVSFYSSANNLIGHDGNGVPDVFLFHLGSPALRRVTVSSRERPQNHAVPGAFDQVSDVSRGGRFVVFDSDATNLVPRDRRGHTDVFVRDVRRGITTRASHAPHESNSDSVYPRITPDGRFVTFESFASNLTPSDAAGADVFLVDRRYDWTTLMDVTNRGRPRGREHVRQLLQRPSVSDNGGIGAFTTTARLIGADHDARANAYVRFLLPAKVSLRMHGPRYRVTVDDRHARQLRCRVGGRLRHCGHRGSFAHLPHRHKKYVLHVRAFGPGIRLSGEATQSFKR